MISTPDRMRKLELIDEALAGGARPAAACAMVQLSARTYYNYRRELTRCGSTADRRPQARRAAPAWRYSDQYRRELVALCNTPEYQDLTPYEICCDQLARHGRYLCSPRTLCRILKEHGQARRRDRRRPSGRSRPQAVYASGPNQIWMWDITYIKSHIRGLFWYLYVFLDLYDRSVVGFGLYPEESAEHAGMLIRSICLEQRRLSTQPLILHSDNGAVMKRTPGRRRPGDPAAALMLGTLEDLGITASFSRPRVSNDNPYAESFFATFKTRFDYPGSGFESLQQAREHISAFVEWYNHEHLHQGLNYVTPMQRRRGEEGAIFARRREVTEAYRKDHPERWHGRPVRSWNLPQRVRLGYGDEPELIVPPLQISGESADCSFLKTM